MGPGGGGSRELRAGSHFHRTMRVSFHGFIITKIPLCIISGSQVETEHSGVQLSPGLSVTVFSFVHELKIKCRKNAFCPGMWESAAITINYMGARIGTI